MKFYPPSGHCQNCFYHIEQRVLEYSLDNYRFALCIPCQHALKSTLHLLTEEARELYFLLKKRNVPAVLQNWEEQKRVHIAVVERRINIEIQSGYHRIHPRRALQELKKAQHSFEKGWTKLQIPHMLIKDNLEETADHICYVLSQHPQHTH